MLPDFGTVIDCPLENSKATLRRLLATRQKIEANPPFAFQDVGSCDSERIVHITRELMEEEVSKRKLLRPQAFSLQQSW